MATYMDKLDVVVAVGYKYRPNIPSDINTAVAFVFPL